MRIPKKKKPRTKRKWKAWAYLMSARGRGKVYDHKQWADLKCKYNQCGRVTRVEVKEI